MPWTGLMTPLSFPVPSSSQGHVGSHWDLNKGTRSLTCQGTLSPTPKGRDPPGTHEVV